MADSIPSRAFRATPLDALRRRVARIEGPRRESAARTIFGCEPVDAVLGGGLEQGCLHEILASPDQPSGSGTALAAMLCRRAGGEAWLWLRTERAERQWGALHAPGLADLGMDPDRLLTGVLPDDEALLNAAVEAARCPALTMLVVECWGNPRALDMTMSRRLTLAAEASGVTLLLLRMTADASPTAARTRWRVRAAPSAVLALRAPGAANGIGAHGAQSGIGAHGAQSGMGAHGAQSGMGAPGAPMLGLELLRQRAGASGQRWTLEWRRDDGRFTDAPLAAPTFSGAQFPDSVRRPLAAIEGLRRSA